MVTGYAHPEYARSLAEFGNPRELPLCGGWILEREIPGFPYRDAMGCYPVFACQDWSQLHCDLKDIGSELISLALVTDPFGEYDEGCLRQCFREMCIPFKEHFVADLRSPINTVVSKRHRYYSRKALENVCVQKCDNPREYVNEWIELYANLVKRHHLVGIKAFSRMSLTKQLSIPGIVMFRAVSQGATVGANLWYVQGEVAYWHLAAYSPLGYDLMASYALCWSAIEYLADKVRWLDLGAGAGTIGNGADGLSQFKRGWSTGTRTAYFCGRVFDYERYTEIVKARGTTSTDYFPAYRKGEFG
ncbi:MAG: GNAT family N-acetyltransferase [Sedimentisphaerales bacterium]|nr:GNAT family N-acetyltransferase [Sedimentisphaerales bacterium]